MTRNPSQYPMPTQSPAAHPCTLTTIRRPSQKALKNDTPDAIADCTAYRPLTQCWCGFVPTTPYREADHGQTIARVTH